MSMLSSQASRRSLAGIDHHSPCRAHPPCSWCSRACRSQRLHGSLRPAAVLVQSLTHPCSTFPSLDCDRPAKERSDSDAKTGTLRNEPQTSGSPETYKVDDNLLDLGKPACRMGKIVSCELVRELLPPTVVAKDVVREVDDPPALDVGEFCASSPLASREILWS